MNEEYSKITLSELTNRVYEKCDYKQKIVKAVIDTFVNELQDVDSSACYEGVTMSDDWKNNSDSFINWYLQNYYYVSGENMAVDKDLFSNGESKVYSSETCCILPQVLNTMLSNCKKHKDKSGLPLGVSYDKYRNLYFAQITPFGHTETVKLSNWSTPEEAFAEYKVIKQADIILMAIKYKRLIGDRIYAELLRYEVKPYADSGLTF